MYNLSSVPVPLLCLSCLTTIQSQEVPRTSCASSSNSSSSSAFQDRLADFRERFMIPYKVYIVTSFNEFLMLDTPLCENRLWFISGYPMPAKAVITERSQAIWVLDEHSLIADDVLDCNWRIFVENGDKSLADFLIDEGQGQENWYIASDPRIVSASDWIDWREALTSRDRVDKPMHISVLPDNLIDRLKTSTGEGPVACETFPLFLHDVRYAGEPWTKKVSDLRQTLQDIGVHGMVITSPSELAWLLNLRGNDFQFSPLFRGFGLLNETSISLFIDKSQEIPQQILRTLREINSTHIYDIKRFYEILNYIPQDSKILVSTRYGTDQGSSFAVYERLLSEDRGRYASEYKRVLLRPSPIQQMKAVLNAVESKKMMFCNRIESAICSEFIAELASYVASLDPRRTQTTPELFFKSKLETLHKNEPTFNSSSTPSIFVLDGDTDSEYMALQSTGNTTTALNSWYQLRTGGQYTEGGTTLASRILFTGLRPHKELRLLYTTILRAHIAVSSSVFQEGTSTTVMDALARSIITSAGLHCPHVTGFQTSSFLKLFEGPLVLSQPSKSSFLSSGPLQEGMFLVVEPGGFWTERGIGGRLGNIYRVRKSASSSTSASVLSKSTRLLEFEPVTLVPFERALIDPDQLSIEELNWLNTYHNLVSNEIGSILHQKRKTDAYNFLLNATSPIMTFGRRCGNSGGGSKPSLATEMPILPRYLVVVFSVLPLLVSHYHWQLLS
ncbi:unnamed protein product [Cyprideis torosa]|uniref:Uncharacterized protein n=1 Tax=Cyprideis torosa TaxID=163714 RepID=A0A7R8W1F1_9CRUS|nr:unnamed protein product [Cyprideis torosa]CAG0880660.1 unnamed protein product [Cyprideis torosa]